MKHAIIGAGNLGRDIFSEAVRAGHQAWMFSKSNGFDITDQDATFDLLARSPMFDVVWYCVGAGSVNEAINAPDVARELHVSTPTMLMACLPPKVRFVCFSTDYVADEGDPSNPLRRTQTPLSRYAELKAELEYQAWRLRPGNMATVRVGSLFGAHYPDRTFPYKCIHNFAMAGETIKLPMNLVTPTPTLWAAAMLIDNVDALFDERKSTIHHCAPDGSLPVVDWGKFILRGMRSPSSFSRTEWFDKFRPRTSALGCSFTSRNWHWHEVWKTYFRHQVFTPRELLRLLPPEIVLADGHEAPAS